MNYLDFSNELKKRGLSNNIKPEPSPSSSENYAQQVVNLLQQRGYKFDQQTEQDREFAAGFFQKPDVWDSIWDDGYQLGDITASILGTGVTILGTGADVLTHAAKGVVQTAEGIADALSYGAAGVVDLFGDKQWADDIRKNAKFSVSDWAFDSVSKALDEISVLGHMSESVAEGLGQIGVMAATGGVAGAAGLGQAAANAITLGTMGVSSMGSGMGEAYEGGATNKEALVYGLISGTAETLSEMLFGGLGKGVNALGFNKGLLSADDLAAKKISGLFKSTFMKNLSEVGVKAAGEGVEEVVSGIASAIGKKVTYMDEKSLNEIFSNENLLEQFVVGAVTSGISQTPGMIKDTKAKKDMITGHTKSEQSVVDSEVKSQIEAREKESGGKLTAKEKGTIRAKVEQDLRKGYISPETIEKTMGGEAYEQYQKLVNESEEFNDLYDQPYEKLSEKQRDRLAELKKKNEASSYDDAIYNAYETLKNQVTDGGNSFQESYAERGRRAQKFQADVSKYDEKYRSTVQKAIDSGILNNTNRSHEFVDLVAKIGADTGTQFDFANNKKLSESGFAVEGKTVNGVTTKDGITINTDSAKALNTVVGHEITHVLEGSDLYNALQTAIFDYAKGKGDFDGRRAALETLYKGVEGANIDTELTADLVGDYLFTDEAFLKELSGKHRNVFQKIYDEIKHLCKLATAGSKEARQLEQVKKAFEDAYREAGQSETTKNTAENGGVKYSLTGVNEYGIEVYETSQEVKDMSWNERKARYLDVMKNEYRGRTAKFERNGHTYYAQFDQSSIRKHIYGDSRASTGGVKALTKAGADGDVFTLVENAGYSGSKQNTKNHTNADYFDYFVKTVQIDGKVFDLRADVEKRYDTDGGYVYTLALRENNKTKAAPALGTSQSEPVKGAGTASTNNISNSGEKVNTKFSLSDSQGRKLSNDQAEYFRNAKTVDENGNLKPFYHGTARSDRVGYYFNPERATSGPMAYFTDSKKIADNYARDKADTSLAYDEAYDDYYTQFRMNVNGEDVSVSEAWKQLPISKRNEIREKAKHITMGEDYSGVIYDENAQYGPGGLDAYTINAHRGNVLEALTDVWLESGTIYGEEQMFLDVLKLAGLDDVQYMNPDFRAEKTYEVYLNITNPFDTSNISSEMVDALKEAADNAEYEGGNAADMWDKRNVDPAEWIERLEKDIENGTTHAWTSVPDFVTDTLKAHGYDGILDRGGKNGGETHTVAIPFYSEQIKDVDNRTPTVNPDIRYSLSPEGEQSTRYGDYNVYGDDVTRLAWDDIAPPVETAQNTEPAVVDDIAPTREEIANLDMQRAAQQENQTISPVRNAVNDDIAPTGNSIIDLQAKMDDLTAQFADLFERVDTNDPQWQQEYIRLNDQYNAVSKAIENWERQASDVELSKNAVTTISRSVRNILGLSNRQMADARGMIEKYSDRRIPSREQLYNEVFSLFGEYSEKIVNEDLRQAKQELRTYSINVSESIKGQIADYNDLRKRNFGKIRFSKDGLAVDVAYQELQEIAPGLFPDDIINPVDQLLRIVDVANMQSETVYKIDIDADTLWQATDEIINGVNEYKHKKLARMAGKQGVNSAPIDLEAVLRNRRQPIGVPLEDLAPTIDTESGQKVMYEGAETNRKLEREKAILADEYRQRKAELESEIKDRNAFVSGRASELYQEIRGLKKGVRASGELGYILDHGYEWSSIRAALVNIQHTPNTTVNQNSPAEAVIREMLGREYDEKGRELDELGNEYLNEVEKLEAEAKKEARRATRKQVYENNINEAKTVFAQNGYDFDQVLKNAKDLSTLKTVDNTPQRVMEKALGWKEGKILSSITADRVAQNESNAIKWLNSYTNRKDGVLAKISGKYNIKPGSEESAAAQMYAEGFYVNENNEIVRYGDAELAADFPDTSVQKNIKELARDPQIRQIYDETLNAINESRRRNGYPEIPRLENYFLHFRAMSDTFSQLGLPFNPNDIRAKDLPTDLNGVTADLKPGQPYFASAQHRRGKRTSFDLLGGLEMYLNAAKNQIYHIDDIQMLRALRNYIADGYGQANGLDNIDALSEEEAQERIKAIYNSHLSTFAKFLNEEANVLAGKTSLIDRGLEGVIGRRGITFLETVNRQVGANMVGFNVSSALTNTLSVVQAAAKTGKGDMVKAFAQTVSNRLTGKHDAFIENNPTVIRRRGVERFHRTPWQKVSDVGYALAGAVDDISTEMIVRAKYNELTGKGMDSQEAIVETDKWVSRLMGDRSLGQMPQIYNSKMLGIFTKFQLEVRNQLDAMFYDTIQEKKASNENIQDEMQRNAKTAAQVTSTLVQLAVLQHLFGTAFEAVAGYNPAFDIISVLMTAFGLDDDEEDDDTAMDNLGQAFAELLDDMPYTSAFTGGRIPIASALPIEELLTGKDRYGNEKSRLGTIAEAIPYYLLPGGYGQAKKTIQGLGMFDDDLPIAGSYTDSGNLRFPVEDTMGNRVQAAVFGQYANKNARDYFNNDWGTLKENQIGEYADLGISVKDYRTIRNGLSKIESDKDADGNTIAGSKKKKIVQYIDDLDLTAAQKVTLYSGQYESEKDKVLERLTANFDNEDYWAWLSRLSSIEPDRDENGKTISGSKKEKVVALLNSLDHLEYGQKIILYRAEYPSDDTYCADIVQYLNELDGLKYADRVAILKALDFRISEDGTRVYWD